jgi:hypothetical protein
MVDGILPCWLHHKYNGQSDILWDCNYEHVYPIGPFVLCRLYTAITISIPLASWMYAKCCFCLWCLRFGYNGQSCFTGQWCTYHMTGRSSINDSGNVQVVAIVRFTKVIYCFLS